MPRLKRVDPSEPGIVRRRRGRGFEYLDERGERITDPDVLERIRALAVPPAWREVWICPFPNGHIQATGVDAAGRKQYRYHRLWRERRDQQKFDEMVAFARALPRLRKAASRDLAGDELTRERVLACAVRLLDRGFFRVGGEEYAEENGSYGLATMRKGHVKLGEDGLITFDYPAKGGKRQLQSIVDSDACEVVAGLKARRGGGLELLAYCENGAWRDIRSEDINEYIKEATGGDFSAKDFRTWNATMLAAMSLAVSAPAVAQSKTARKRVMTRAVEEVAHYLGNTPTVCRASYIDPRVFDRFQSGLTIGGVVERVDLDRLTDLKAREKIERGVLDLLEEEEESAAIEKVA